MHPLRVKPGNVWEFPQNKPSLVQNDLYNLYGVPRIITAKILMARGVYKWLAVRRQLIKLKNTWKGLLTNYYRSVESGNLVRGTAKYHEAKGYAKALERCRKEVRTLCHSARWAIPDFENEDLLGVRETPKESEHGTCTRETA